MTDENRRRLVAERKYLALQELKRRQEAAPLAYYKPHAGQNRIYDAIKSGIRIILAVPGNRFGKTYSAMAYAVAFVYGYWIWDVPGLELTEQGDYPPREKIPPEYWIRYPNGQPLILPVKFIVVSGLPALQGLHDILHPTLEAFVPPAVRARKDFRVARGSQSTPLYVQFPKDGSTRGAIIYYGTAEQDPITFEGRRFDGAITDEPPSQAVFNGIWTRLTDRGGQIIMLMTPLGHNADWVYDNLVAQENEHVQVIHGSIWENPYVEEENKKELLDNPAFSDEEREAREKGTFMALTHRAFPQFDPAAHVIPSGQVPAGWVRGVACDPAHRRPFALTWAAFGPNGEVLVYREWPERDHSKIRSSELSVADYAQIIRNLERGEHIDFRVLDPRFGVAKHRVKGAVTTSIQQDFAEEGLHFDCRIQGTEREETGIERIRGLLSFDRHSPLTELNRPKLRIMDHCINTINTLAFSNFKPPSPREQDVLEEKLKEKYKDFRDNLRYLILYPYLSPEASSYDSYITDEDLASWNDW